MVEKCTILKTNGKYFTDANNVNMPWQLEIFDYITDRQPKTLINDFGFSKSLQREIANYFHIRGQNCLLVPIYDTK